MTAIKKELKHILGEKEYTLEQLINKLGNTLTWANRATLLNIVVKYIQSNYLTSRGGKIALKEDDKKMIFETKNLKNGNR